MSTQQASAPTGCPVCHDTACNFRSIKLLNHQQQHFRLTITKGNLNIIRGNLSNVLPIIKLMSCIFPLQLFVRDAG
jgi:hypothetical protein